MTRDSRADVWAVVLAAGDGARLRSLTLDPRGRSVPKQFCSLRGGASLLEESLLRARSVAPPERTVVVVARRHRPYWRPLLGHLPPSNVLVQPSNRGTAAGLLLPLCSVLERDPHARVVVLQSDHHVADEATLEAALRFACRQLEDLRAGAHALLLGITPDAAESGYGWIVHGPGEGLLRRVERFVEKPDPALARWLLRDGALWSSFILVARATSLLGSIERRLPGLVAEFRALGALDGLRTPAALEALYARLPAADFSRDVLQGSEDDLLVMQVPACGWTDLGTPERVRACLAGEARLPSPGRSAAQVVLARRLAEQVA